MTPAELIALAERLEGAEEGSRALDAEVLCAVRPDLNSRIDLAWPNQLGQQRHQEGGVIVCGDLSYSLRYTSHMDCAVSLINDALPAPIFWLVSSPTAAHTSFVATVGSLKQGWIGVSNEGPALALCAALCRAKAAEMEG